MSEQSNFNLSQASEEAFVEPSGILDQLNLPAGFVSFLRENKTILKISAIIIVVLVVTISLYMSYQEKRLEGGASSLAISMEAEGDAKAKGLQHVVDEFSGTPSAFWAGTELGHIAMKDGKYAKASQLYQKVRQNVKTENPQYALLTYGIAQSYEAAKNYAKATAAYAELKEIEGYKDEGYLGMARVLEKQGEKQKAINTYEEYLGSMIGENQDERVKNMVQEKITRLRVE